jgi:hypothetical protein
MNFRKRLVVAALLGGGLVVLASAPALAGRNDKVEICLNPSGAPEATRTLKVSKTAAEVLLARAPHIFSHGPCEIGY